MLDNTSSVRSDSSRLDMLAAAVTMSNHLQTGKKPEASVKFSRRYLKHASTYVPVVAHIEMDSGEKIFIYTSSTSSSSIFGVTDI